MLFTTPPITAELEARLGELDELRRSLGQQEGRHLRWMGTLRRQAKATSVESSTGIEGFHVSPGEAFDLVNSIEQPDPNDENRMAVACYSRAMDHVSVMARDPDFRWTDRVFSTFTLMPVTFRMIGMPGLWRTGPVGITGSRGELVVICGPDADEVPSLMAEVMEWLEYGELDTHVAVRAAMAHLHTVSIHPFKDGNGRISRIVQSLVLAREGVVSPEFASIEEYVGAHTPEYYAALQAAHGDHYQPGGDVSTWVSFCLEAHLVLGRRRLEQIEYAGRRWLLLEEMVEDRNWQDRMVIALEQVLVGGSNRTKYATEAGVSSATAVAISDGSLTLV